MVSSLSIFFIVAFYFYFKQHYEKLIAAKIDDIAERESYLKKLKMKLMIFPAGAVAIVVLYAISYTLMRLYPDSDVDVKSLRRIVDAAAVIMFAAVFMIDKRELDHRLRMKKKIEPLIDKNEPGIDIPEPVDVI
ncbi:MAG: hypothetical protein ABIN91_05925 [Mucilaginibacter sp.]|uniref:hypothetical protein n=1 Tax=Mucilaginibacter sp. TaxID=1882438 RepID=UPI0032632751